MIVIERRIVIANELIFIKKNVNMMIWESGVYIMRAVIELKVKVIVRRSEVHQHEQYQTSLLLSLLV